MGVLGEGEVDVAFSRSGEFIVADTGNNRVCVFSADGAELVREFDGTGPGREVPFDQPSTLFVVGKYLCVLDRMTCTTTKADLVLYE